MPKLLSTIVTILAVVVIAFASNGCKKTTKTTEVKGKLFGGTEVKEKTVTESGDKATVTEKKTEYNDQGEKVKVETKTTGDAGSQ
jgi:uncharacterized lipoprotein NlpE involved in copper resistance